ncbi:MAG: glycosyltransferase family 4 protein [Pyrinomonadaceae bacterium]
MKVVLAVLSGKMQQACDNLNVLYPQATLEMIPRNEIEVGSLFSRLGSLRAKRPDVFAIATERLAWQRGQNLLMLFGAIAGAKEVVMVDAHGGFRKESRSSLLLRAPARLTREAALSAALMTRARRELERLEKEVNDGAQPASSTPPRAPQKSLKITYLRTTPAPGTQAGGAASHIKGVVTGLLELGVEVQLISNDELLGLDGATISTTKIDAESWGITRGVLDINNNAVFTRNALPLIQQDLPDFIYQRYARFSWAGVVATLRTGRPLFLEYNGSEVWVGRHWDRVSMLDLLSRYEHLNLAAATRIFVVSEVERKNLERAGLASEKIIVNPNGVDTDIFRPDVGGARVREQLGVAGEEQLVGFVGSFGPWHGVLVLAEAIKLIPDTSRLRFLLVGTGALHEEMQRLLRAEVEAGRVIFTGAVEHEKIPALLDACDILVSPHIPLAAGAEFFGSPTKLFEYMAMGKGIVASRLGQIGEVLTHEETALLVEPGDVVELSAAITRLSESRALREALGTAARQAACERHTWKRNTENIIAAYHDWLKEPKQ